MKIKCFRQLSLVVAFLMTQTIIAQQVIKLENPSFEDAPRAGHAPKGWNDCGFPDETEPDIQPNFFQVTQVAQHGKTYLGLVARDNDTWESVTQLLHSPMLQGQMYKFSLNLCRSTLYVSKSKKTGRDANYATPIIVRIWGGDGPCAKTEKLAETEPVEAEDWQLYQFQFQPKTTHHYITIEAFHKIPTIFPYNGNVLIDNASDIVPVPPSPIPPPISPPHRPKDGFEQGKTFEIEDLRFNDGSDTIRPAAFETLKKLTEQLKRNPKAIIEIGGHTNGLPKPDYCDSLSLGRANAVRNYLVKKGIKPSRLKAKGYGKRNPKAKDDTKEGREKNQRVEIEWFMNGNAT
jgi:outer membrane protein OmpA-like peptidoglycan-associated protein